MVLKHLKSYKIMKEYQVEIEDLPKIRKLFDGYVFRRKENGIGYVKCTKKEYGIIKDNDIKLTEI
tara:strand:- start:858 stop:1052 length:195 start_codon:yes stop_codon:yes gene_type:complete